MSKKTQLKPIAAAIGTTFAVSLAMSPVVNAADNPFGMTEFQNGYMVAEGACGDKSESEGKCGDKKESEGKCGDKKEKEGKCGEGKCGS